MNPNDTDFELLMAYADGELDAEQARAVEERLAGDPEARAIVERLRQTRAEMADGLGAVLDEPVPQRLIDTVRHHQPPAAAAAATDLPLREAANSASYWPRMAAAACLALAVGLTTGHWWATVDGVGAAREGSLAQTFQRALQTLPSGESLNEGAARVMPVGSFRTAGGGACREFEQTFGGRLSHGVACREAGQWVARVTVDFGPAGGSGTHPPSSFAPASGEADAMAAVLDGLGAGPAIGPDEERELIGRGWEKVGP